MLGDFLEAYQKSFNAIESNRLKEIGTLELAYIGDSVYDLYVRNFLIKNFNDNVNSLHEKAKGIVNAHAQALAANALSDIFNQTEKEYFLKGRNAKSSVPKNMTVGDYRSATGLETVIGYLFATKNMDRLNEIFKVIIKLSYDTM